MRAASSASLGLLLVLAPLACDGGMRKQAAAARATEAPIAPAAPSPARGQPTPPMAQAIRDAAASDGRSNGPSNCRFERPRVWTAGQVSWLGSCRGGFAHGSGVIVNVVEGAESERFYGRLQDGFLTAGVIQSTDGYMAGSWAHGALTEGLANDVAQRNVVIDAFRAASESATAQSTSFARKGDARSSRFYKEQARLLGDQID